MKLSGNLQDYYDVLDEMGVLDHLMKSDWSHLDAIKGSRSSEFNKFINIINRVGTKKEEIKKQLVSYDSQIIQFFAMEVAKEYADFQNNKLAH